MGLNSFGPIDLKNQVYAAIVVQAFRRPVWAISIAIQRMDARARIFRSGADDGKPNTVDGRLVMVADFFGALFSPHGVQPHLSARPDPRSFRRLCRLCRSSIHRTSSGVSTPSVSRLNTRPLWPLQFTTAVATGERDPQRENPSTANSRSRERSTTRGFPLRQFSDSPFTQWDVWDFSPDQSGQRLY